METENLVNHESSRMTAFRILSDCFFLPDPGLSQKLKKLEFSLANQSKSASECARNMREEFEASTNIESLTIDFSKLFAGPYTLLAAPYGSVYLDGERKIMGDSTLDVKNRYRQAGLQTAKNFKDAPDHIAAELEFMHYLIFKEVDAFSNADTEAAIGFIRKQKSFLDDHLMVWVPQFTANIIEHAETLFYQNLARATELFLKKNYEIVCTLLDSKKLNSEKPIEINSLRV